MTSMKSPVKSRRASKREQSLAALERANEVRMSRARIKASIGRGSLTVPDVLEHPDVATMTLGELLAAQHGWGPRRVARFLNALDLTVAKRIGSLTVRQRDVIGKALR